MNVTKTPLSIPCRPAYCNSVTKCRSIENLQQEQQQTKKQQRGPALNRPWINRKLCVNISYLYIFEWRAALRKTR